MIGFNSEAVKSRARMAVRESLALIGDMIAQASLKEVPRKTGNLARSIYVKTDGLSAEVGYSADYAAVVHKEKDYLTGPFMRLENECLGIIKESVEEAIR